MPGRETEITVPVTISKKAKGNYAVVVYVTGKKGKTGCMNLAMTDEIADKLYRLYQIRITK